jgi:hypothetical protein
MERERCAERRGADQQDQQRPAVGYPGIDRSLAKRAPNLPAPFATRRFQRLVAPFGSFASLLTLGPADRARVSLVRLGRLRTGLS